MSYTINIDSMKVNPIYDATHTGNAKEASVGNVQQVASTTLHMTFCECISYYFLCMWIETSCKGCIDACDCNCKCNDDDEVADE
jgi:hypothetical protein